MNEWLKLSIYIFSVACIAHDAQSNNELSKSMQIGLAISYLFFGLAWVIDGFTSG